MSNGIILPVQLQLYSHLTESLDLKPVDFSVCEALQQKYLSPEDLRR